MPTKKDAQYWRDRRARLAAEKMATERVAQTPSRPIQSTPVSKASQTKGEVVVATESKYDCGCRPGNLCIGHGIAAMPQRSIDAILDRMNRPVRK